MAANRVFNWRFVSTAYTGEGRAWTRFHVVDEPRDEALQQLPTLIDEPWPSGIEGPIVRVSRAWYDEFRYRIEEAFAACCQRLIDAYALGDVGEIASLTLHQRIASQARWAPDRPQLMRELLRAR